MNKNKLGKTDLYISQVGLGVGGILVLKMFNKTKPLWTKVP